MYCLKCHKQTENQGDVILIDAGKCQRESTHCKVCGVKKNRFCKKTNGKGIGDLINQSINKLPFEAHLVDQADDGKIKSHSFTGPGTRLDKRLNSDDTPKAFSQPINRLDQGAYKHDLCYRDSPDAKARRETCDPPLINHIGKLLKDPSLPRIQRINANIANVAMKSKKRFGGTFKKSSIKS